MNTNETKPYSPFREFLTKFLKQKMAVAAFAVVILILFVGLFGSLLAPYDPHRPVTSQYPGKGIDLDQLTNASVTIEGVLTDGSTIEGAEIAQLTADSENRRIASIRRSARGILVNGNTSGFTNATIESGDVSSSFQVVVEGESLLEGKEPVISQLIPSQPEGVLSPGDEFQLNVTAILTDGEEITEHADIHELALRLYETEESEEVSSGFNAPASDAEAIEGLHFSSLDEDVAEVSDTGVVTVTGEGDGAIRIQTGPVSSVVQIAAGEQAEPVLAYLNVSEPNVTLTDVYKHQPPSSIHYFGTDHQNRDIFSRVIHGTQDTLLIGFVSVAIGAFIGTALGLLAGFYGRWVDSVVTRMTDVLLAFPGILLAIAVIAFLGAGITNIILAVAVFTIPVFIRIVRGSTLALKEMTYVEAARSIGVKDPVIILRHIFPGTLSVVMVYLTMRIGVAILIGAALSFLGLGGDITAPEWGSMLSAAKDNSGTVFHATFFPGLAIVITVLSFNILGDGLRDALDPKLKE
ncbi:ABC transporter permease [Alteribacter keqinensis]|uniref:Glutathione transport system permease protein GsiD n=1 Tax=Alteribacter keqinensis TaxID=2483800 RepID=A0A3M7TX08_9BACI|nr:ABC transporter permease subunit [Alteribacter keqinensis]RNA70147.1 ABC transporter permease subunit [Alteribacter keqinensis]